MSAWISAESLSRDGIALFSGAGDKGKMRIVHVMRELKPSGAEVMLRLAAPVWKEAGCDLHVVATMENLGIYADELRKAGYGIHHVPLRRGRRLLPSLGDFRRFLKHLKPDIVHVHGEGLNVLICALTSFSGFPCLRTVHNNFLFEKRVRWQKIVERFLVRVCGTKMLAISKSVQENEASRFYNPSRLRWNWFDTETFRPPSAEERAQARKEVGIGVGEFAIVSVGNGSPIKNYGAIVQALAEQSASVQVRYFQVGLEFASDRHLRDSLHLEKIVEFCGPQKDVRKYLWAADLYVMPSQFEGFGLAAAEALATGAPCLFSRVPGLADFADQGFLIEWVDTSAEGVRNGIERALSHRDKAQSRKLQNSGLARKLFAVDAGAGAYLCDWQEVSAKSRNPGKLEAGPDHGKVPTDA